MVDTFPRGGLAYTVWFPPSYEDASVCLEMPNQVTAFHSTASTSGSRMTLFFPIVFFDRVRFAWSTS